jgi:CheY-like chemotaxis protein
MREKLKEDKKDEIDYNIPQAELPKVLMVENDELNKKVTKVFLKGICEFKFTTSGEKALIAFEKEKFDAILMDINPGTGMSRAEAAGKIKQIDAYKDTPIISITAFAMKGDKDEFLKAGCTHYIYSNRLTVFQLAG